MRRRFKLSVLVCVLLIEAIPCKAKVGEELEVCASSYGLRIFPVKHFDADGKNIFQKNGFTYEVTSVKGIVVGVVIQKTDKSMFTNKEKEAVLRDEGGNWKKDRRITNESTEGWRRTDGAVAVFLSVDNSKSWVDGVVEWPNMAFRIHSSN